MGHCKTILALFIPHRASALTLVKPKGGWEQDETQEHAALRETWEEAGIKGRIIRHIGVFEERNKHGVKAHHWIYELEIQEVVEKFPERKKRERRWVNRRNNSLCSMYCC